MHNFLQSNLIGKYGGEIFKIKITKKIKITWKIEFARLTFNSLKIYLMSPKKNIIKFQVSVYLHF